MNIVIKDNKKYQYINYGSIPSNSKNDILVILVHCVSEILGEFYMPMKYKKYKKWYSEIAEITLKYSFFAGVDTEEEDNYEEDYLVNTELKFSGNESLNRVLTKYIEILISEGPMNDLFWLNEAYFCYYYKYHSVKYLSTSNKKRTYNSTPSFFNEYLHDIKGKLFKVNTDKRKVKIEEVIKFNSEGYLYPVYNIIYVPLLSEELINNLRTIKINYYVGDDGVNIEKLSKSDKADIVYSKIHHDCLDYTTNKKIGRLWELPMIDYMINKAIHLNMDYLSHLVEFKIKTTNRIFDNWEEVHNRVFKKLLNNEFTHLNIEILDKYAMRELKLKKKLVRRIERSTI